jgi:ABC-type Mn2+/Zn2+ transport system ATPase subunit
MSQPALPYSHRHHQDPLPGAPALVVEHLSVMAVDAETRAIIVAILTRLGEQGKTVIAATHDLGRLETDFDGALYLANGREVAPPPGAFTGMSVGV